MLRIVHLLMFFGVLSGSEACVPLSNVKPTIEKTRTISLANDDLFAAAVRYTKAQDWTIDVSEPGLGWLEAISAVDKSAGMTTRERWFLSTRDQELGIRLRLESFEQGRWTSMDVVCESYSYFREDAHLSGIADDAKSRQIARNASSGTERSRGMHRHNP